MEDFHHEHLSDEQMAEPNPSIRNAIATALFSLAHPDDPRCRAYSELQARLIRRTGSGPSSSTT
jgi:hypothetical protein